MSLCKIPVLFLGHLGTSPLYVGQVLQGESHRAGLIGGLACRAQLRIMPKQPHIKLASHAKQKTIIYQCDPNDVNPHTALQSQKAVAAYLKSKQLLPFGFARRYRSEEGIPPIASDRNSRSPQQARDIGLYCTNVGLMLGQRRRRWIDSKLIQCL